MTQVNLSTKKKQTQIFSNTTVQKHQFFGAQPSSQSNSQNSKATLWVKAQHEGALPPPCIVRKDPRVPHPRMDPALLTP